jgi:hypothetical protein
MNGNELSVQPIKEKQHLWTVVALLLAPSLISIPFRLLLGLFKNLAHWGYSLQVGIATAVSILLFALPFFWKGNLSWREIWKKIGCRSDGVSILLAIAPIAIWFTAVILLTAQSVQPYFPRLPLWVLENLPYKVESILSLFVTSWTGPIGILLLANASTFADRIKYLMIFACSIVFYVLAEYGYMILTSTPTERESFNSFNSPMTNIVYQIGFNILLVGLMQRGKNSVKAIAIMLFSLWIVRFLGMSSNIIAMAMGLFGGAGLIFLVNYLQRTGRWVRWSAESAVESTEAT